MAWKSSTPLVVARAAVGYPTGVRPVCVVVAFLAACSGGGGRGHTPQDPGGHGQLAEEDRFVPSYGKPELQKALISERAAEATGERMVSELEGKSGDTGDQLRVASADLAVRRRFIA